ncbi:MAG TPA: hypothetical protein VJ964_15300, partial [Balneolaceae bacterium]|nr:hypothetical protein [Balneolaceae bacterium]
MAIALVACNAHNREHQKLMGVYKTGPYRVGFRSLAVRDSMRTIGDSAYRPVQIGFWYPRKAGDQMRFMTFRNYFLLSAQEMGPGKLNSDSLIGNYKKLAVRFGVTKHGIDSLFSMSFIAKDGAPVRGGNFPMVLVGQGNMQTIFHQVVLCEYLASHGFYVVTTPSPTRITGFYKGYNGLVAKAREQGADLAFARRKILQITDRKNIPTGIVAYSFSARAALLYAVKHSGLKAFISLDG